MPDPGDSFPPSAGRTPEEEGLPELTPDLLEQEHGEEMDNVVPTHGYATLPVVGLGGSAGGLAPLQEFFAAVPTDSGMAYVVILHLSPDHESHLAELLQRSTSLPVTQVQSRTKVEPDHVYVIPPAKHLSINDGHLSLTDINRLPGKHVAVDLFFRTLADAHGPHSAAVVLSGADGDGAIGLKRIKERGGLAVVQEPAEAEFDSMPRTSIATGLVDWVLPMAQIPARLVEYWHTEKRLRLPLTPGEIPDAEAGSPPQESTQKSADEGALHDILSLLRVRTGHDFTCYKRATVLRRIARRMQVHTLAEPTGYLELLRARPEEPQALLKDLLISVTNFFRDREAFKALETMIPALFHGKTPTDTVRVWVPACATGEEAYSMAMLLLEHAARLEKPPTLQVFATDLDESAIQTARDGTYPETIVSDVSQERLRRFFNKEHGGYCVRRELRETVLFALHDLLRDSPFSRLDLVSCRNLLIYLNRDAQAHALEIFHFALRPEGTLFLGTSESVDEGSMLFAEMDKKRRLYVRRPGKRQTPQVFAGLSTLTRVLRQAYAPDPGQKPAAPPAARPAPTNGASANGTPRNWSSVHYEFLEQVAPPSVIVDHDYSLVHVSEQAGRFLQIGGGNVTNNLLRLAHPLLRVELRAALYQATQTGVPATVADVPFETGEGIRRRVTLKVVPSHGADSNLLLVLFQEQPEGTPGAPGASAGPAAGQSLAHQLEQTRVELRDTVEQSEAAGEELKASNEELQAINEELRSTTEELETGREELQSTNEELNTVNQELKSKVEELGRSNSDLHNLINASQIATIFLDRHLCIQRYTPPAVALFNLIPSDVGRPLSDLTIRLDYPGLTADAERVLVDLSVVEVEVRHRDGRSFLARILPYRTTEDVIAGVVMTFVNITLRRQAEDELRESEERFRTVANLVPDLLFRTDAAGNLRWCNQRWLDYTGQTHLQAQDGGWVESIDPEDRERVKQAFTHAVAHGDSFHSEHRLLSSGGKSRWFLVRAEPLRNPEGQIMQWFGAKTDIDDFKHATAELARSEGRLQLILENAREFAIFSTDLESRVTTWNTGAERLLGYTREEILGQTAKVIFTPEDRAAGRADEEIRQALAEGRASDERWHQRKDGSRFWASGAMMRMNDARGQAVGLVKILRDQTEARQTREQLEHSREELLRALQENERARLEVEAAGKAKDHFLAVLSHELRTPLTPVIMGVHLLNRRRDLPAAAREALAMIERNVQIEAHLIDDLLDLTRISHGKLDIVREPADLHEAVRQAAEISTEDMEQKKQAFTLKLAADDHQVQGDAKRLRQVFWNLLKNASKFTPDGGSIQIRSHNTPGRVFVEVSDSGIGFEPEVATRIFDAFSQASPEVTRRYGGLGLGLAIAEATVDAHDGVLSAHSEGPDRGATFTVELPLAGTPPE